MSTAEEQAYDAQFASLDMRGIAEVAVESLEQLGITLNDTALLDRTNALARRLEQVKAYTVSPGQHGRARCPRCLRDYAVNGDGTLRRHTTASGRPCRERKA